MDVPIQIHIKQYQPELNKEQKQQILEKTRKRSLRPDSTLVAEKQKKLKKFTINR